MLTKEAEAEQKIEILNWISAVIGEPIDTKEPFEKILKDGVILCKCDLKHFSILIRRRFLAVSICRRIFVNVISIKSEW